LFKKADYGDYSIVVTSEYMSKSKFGVISVVALFYFYFIANYLEFKDVLTQI